MAQPGYTHSTFNWVSFCACSWNVWSFLVNLFKPLTWLSQIQNVLEALPEIKLGGAARELGRKAKAQQPLVAAPGPVQTRFLP